MALSAIRLITIHADTLVATSGGSEKRLSRELKCQPQRVSDPGLRAI
jgi:hypothetical protein